MKYQIKKKTELKITLDSSEALMFTKGGKHSIFLSDDDLPSFDEAGEVEISVQLERGQQTRFDHVTQHGNIAGDIYTRSK